MLPLPSGPQPLVNSTSVDKVLRSHQRALEFLCAEAEHRLGLVETRRSALAEQGLQKTRVFRARDHLNEAKEVLRQEVALDQASREAQRRSSETEL